MEIPDNANTYSKSLLLGLWRIFREERKTKELNLELGGIKIYENNTLNLWNMAEKLHLIKVCSSDLRERRRKSFCNRSDYSSNIINNTNMMVCRTKQRSKSTLSYKLLIISLLILLFTNLTEGCGPGRGPGRRRAPRKLTPLVYKQHVPNVPENALSASGLSEGQIVRGDPGRFKGLVPNYNTDISFRDDEGTGADRLMTQRLKEKLNTLAISVMNQWPGVKLRVIEGWDEENLHANHSLHYEGRAVDLTTSDKDRSKYGMLARLAVEAGFDWVYYESRAHIHCSVKSDAFQTGRSGGCFSGNSTVQTPSGPKSMSNLLPGDQVLTIDPSTGELQFSPVLLFLDHNRTETREFYRITTSTRTITLTPSHLIYTFRMEEGLEKWKPNSNHVDEINEYDTNLELLEESFVTFARNLAIGDWILVQPTDKWKALEKERILNIESVQLVGVYAPLTPTGTILVDSIFSSCYALIQSQSLAHWSFLPIRLLNNLYSGLGRLWKSFSFIVTLRSHPNHINGGELLKTLVPRSANYNPSPEPAESQGIHWYASFLYSVTSWILPNELLYP